MHKSMWDKIKMWRTKYNKTPNGWVVAQMIGSDYTELQPKRKKRA